MIQKPSYEKFEGGRVHAIVIVDPDFPGSVIYWQCKREDMCVDKVFQRVLTLSHKNYYSRLS